MNWWDEPCTCGHTKVTHRNLHEECTARLQLKKNLVWVSPLTGNLFCGCTKFKLDNLGYIEQLAEDKGLI